LKDQKDALAKHYIMLKKGRALLRIGCLKEAYTVLIELKPEVTPSGFEECKFE